MVLGGCLTCVKYLMFIFNFIFWLIGCILLSLGIWVLVDNKTFETTQVADFAEIGPYILIAVGSVILIVGFLGCCGSIRESPCMLATFFVFLFIIFAILAACGIFLIIKRKDIGKDIYDQYKTSAQNYNEAARKAYVDAVHTAYECCGYSSGTSDFDSYDPKPPGCPKKGGGQVNQICTSEHFDAKLETIQQHALIIGLCCIAVGIVLILGMIFSMLLCCAIRDTI